MTPGNRTLRRTTLSGAVPGADLDVTPVLNMFIILIPFLVSMAAFTHLSSVAFGLPADEGPGQAQTADELPLTVAVGRAGLLVVIGDIELAQLPAVDGGQDLERLTEVLGAERRREPRRARLVLAVDDEVSCAVVVACLDHCREAGFTDIGLAAGTGVVLREGGHD